MTRPPSPLVIVLGGGLAGLTAAYRLTSQGARVTVLDRRSAVGGDAIQPAQGWKSVPLLASNSHHATWALWRSLQSQIGRVSFTNVSLEFLLPDGRTAAYPFTPLPRPIHLAVSLLRFNGLTWRERWRLVSWLEQIWEGAVQLPSNLTHRTADEWLATFGQGDLTRRTIWDPLAQWLTGNQLTRLSADALRTAVEPTFCRTAHGSLWSITSGTLRESLLQPMIEKLSATGTAILLNSEATQLLSDGDRVAGVLLRNGTTLQSDVYLAALPHRQLVTLLPERWLSRYAYFQQLAELADLSTIVVQVLIRHPLTKPRIILLSHGPFRSMVAQPSGSGHTACHFVGRDERIHAPTTPEALRMHAEDILHSLQLLPANESVLSFDSQKDEDGTLSLEPGMQLRRPLQRSPIANLLVAGAWTDTGWSPNLESAIVSANRCAEIIASPRLNRDRRESL